MEHDDTLQELTFRKIIFKLGSMRDSKTGWNKTPTHAEFVPPAIVPALLERCERVLELLHTDEIRSLPSGVRRRWFTGAVSIQRDVEQADEARRQFLHPLATAERRDLNSFLVNHYLGEAHEKGTRIARDLERERLMRKRRPRQEKPQDACVRALLRAMQFLSPERWCKNAEAKDKRGQHIRWNSPHAHSFSIVGAILASTQNLGPDQKYSTLRFVGHAAKCRNTQELQEWNDKLGTTHLDLRRIIRAAIRLMARQGLNSQAEFEL